MSKDIFTELTVTNRGLAHLLQPAFQFVLYK